MLLSFLIAFLICLLLTPVFVIVAAWIEEIWDMIFNDADLFKDMNYNDDDI